VTAVLVCSGFLVLLAVTFVLAFRLGFRTGGGSWLAELQRVRAESAVAERQMHDLTARAFVAMAEQAEGQRAAHRLTR
jgi:hypothetical protein